MGIATIILVYLVIWWLVFFMMLPVGVKAQHEAEDQEMVEGTAPSAPVNPDLKKKILITSLITLVLTVGYYFLATSGLISFRTPRG